MTDRVVANISSHENLNGFDLLSDEDQVGAPAARLGRVGARWRGGGSITR